MNQNDWDDAIRRINEVLGELEEGWSDATNELELAQNEIRDLAYELDAVQLENSNLAQEIEDLQEEVAK